MKRAEIKNRVWELSEKYFELVWFARTARECPNVSRIMTTYPEECAKLSSDDGGWEHGFNSGCLAAFRLILGLMGTKADVESAEESFPELDT